MAKYNLTFLTWIHIENEVLSAQKDNKQKTQTCLIAFWRMFPGDV